MPALYLSTNSMEKLLKKKLEPICESQGFCFVIRIKVAAVQGRSLEFDLLCTATSAEF